MGLTLHYQWKAKIKLPTARRLVRRMHKLAKQLPFDSVSKIYEQDAPDGEYTFHKYNHPFRRGDMYLPRKRDDGHIENVFVEATHAMFFICRVEGSETAAIGLASHPAVVEHNEERVEIEEDGIETTYIGAGAPVEFETRRRGYYSWQGFCKTQYAANPKLGGDANFLKAHLSLIELLDQIRALGFKVRVLDDSDYHKHRDVNRLLQTLRKWDGLIAGVAGQLGDFFKEQGLSMEAPIKDRPDFEHLEAKGVEMLREMAEKQRQRKTKRGEGEKEQ
jgi:hypothetical protein